MASDQTLKIGLVGCGGLGSRHAAHVESIEGAKLVAVCDHERASAEALSDKLASQPAIYDNHRTMLSAQSPDAVLVVTPNFVHSPITVDAATAGAHVFCEKPMALTVEDCDAMIEAADNAGVFLMIGYVRRFQNAYREMKRLIAEGQIGEIRMAHTVRLGTGARGSVARCQLDRERNGGLFTIHSPELDQLTWMAGEVRAVQAVMRYDDASHNTVEESIFINLEFSSGAIGSLSSSRIYPGGSYELGVAGTEGSVKITSGTGAQLTLNRVGEKSEHMTYERNNGLLEEMTYFLNCIRTGEQPQSSGHDGRRTIAISLAAHESARTGQKIEVPISPTK
ncbi:MAG: Gfo/Idh/MocA family oxidoreductase [Gemmatimonadota bacterium]|nr:Gfo/Idh/MocA family oxidoreductase [Gemmatimonadota bacterium]